MNTKKIIALILCIASILSLLSVYSYAETEIILSPMMGEVFYENPTSFALDNSGFSEIVLYLDGELYEETTDSEVLVRDNLSLGEHTLKAVGIFADGTALCDEVTFSVKLQVVNGVGSWKEEKITFDSLDEKYAVSYPMDAEMADDFSEKYGWNLIYTHSSGNDPLTRTLTRIEGKNHSSDTPDYAPVLSYGNVAETAWSGQGGMSFAGADKTREAMQKAGGIYTVEFDMMTFDNSPTMFLYMPFAMWGETSYNGQYLLTNGTAKLRETNTTISPNEWHSYKLQYDITNDKWNVWFDGAHVVEDVPARTDYHNNDIFRIEIVAKKDAQNKFAIDNFKMSHQKIYNGVKKVDFISAAGTFTDKNYFPPDVTEIKVTLSDKLDVIENSDITLRTTEGRIIESQILYDNEKGVLEIFPQNVITPDCDMEIVYQNDKLPSGFVYKIRSGNNAINQNISFKADAKDVYSLKQLKGCAALACNASVSLPDGVESFKGVYVLTVSKNNKIVSMTAKEVSLSGEKMSDVIALTLSLPQDAENADIRLMLCDSLTGCIAQSKYFILK